MLSLIQAHTGWKSAALKNATLFPPFKILIKSCVSFFLKLLCFLGNVTATMATGREQQTGWGWGVGGSLVIVYISFREQKVQSVAAVENSRQLKDD